MPDLNLTELASRAWFYGYPLTYNLSEVIRVSEAGLGALPPAPFNSFSHGSGLAGPEEKFVTVNNDTIYSIASLDLSGGPAKLSVPASGGRYYVLQFVDAWTNNFAYVGSRATGDGAGAFTIVPPGFDGEVTDGSIVIEAPTRVATIVGRIAVYGDDDLPAVRAFQAGISLNVPTGPLSGPTPVTAADEALLFWERLRVWSREFPPAAADIEAQMNFAPLGVFGDTPVDALPAEVRAALIEGASAGHETLESRLATATPLTNGWSNTTHIFDYNLDHFGVGTLADPEWIIDDRRLAYATRALAARAGLWGNHGYEAVYQITYVDQNNQPLRGDRRYELRLEELPPVEFFWSLTMYDTPDFYLVDNPIARYSIGSRTDGLEYGDDGALTIVLQHAPPENQANWLPAPAGTFRPVMRLYGPKPEILNGQFELAAITRID